jgi:GNAT superfamily N-acetyltransferase
MANRLFNKLDTVHQIEEAHILHLSRQVEIGMQLFPHEKISLHPVAGGGVSALTTPHLGQQMNRTLGLGMKGMVTEDDLSDIEALHAASNLTPSILLCPYADQSVLQALAMRSYVVDGFLNIYAQSLHEINVGFDPSTESPAELSFGSNMLVCRAPANEVGMGAFIQASVAGFKDDGRSDEVLRSLAETAALRADTNLYLGKIEGHIAGCGAMALMDTKYGRVAHLYIDSTTPKFRGRGVQQALIRARLIDAKRLGYDFATIHARPGIGTGRNAEKEGFGLAFTKPILTKRSI